MVFNIHILYIFKFKIKFNANKVYDTQKPSAIAGGFFYCNFSKLYKTVALQSGFSIYEPERIGNLCTLYWQRKASFNFCSRTSNTSIPASFCRSSTLIFSSDIFRLITRWESLKRFFTNSQTLSALVSFDWSIFV